MEIRRQLNQNPRTVGLIVGALVLLAVVAAFTASWQEAGELPSRDPEPKEFFSTDDGKTYFAADAHKVPPFDHQNKPAYRARVFKCGANGQPFVAYLERYADADRKRLEEMLAKGGPPSDEVVKLLAKVEVKKPGRPEWVRMTPATGQRFNDVRMPRCPDGSTSSITRVSPQ